MTWNNGIRIDWILITSVAYSVNERGIVVGDYNVLWVVVYERFEWGDPLCLFVHQIERGFGETYCSADLHTGVLWFEATDQIIFLDVEIHGGYFYPRPQNDPIDKDWGGNVFESVGEREE